MIRWNGVACCVVPVAKDGVLASGGLRSSGGIAGDWRKRATAEEPTKHGRKCCLGEMLWSKKARSWWCLSVSGCQNSMLVLRPSWPLQSQVSQSPLDNLKQCSIPAGERFSCPLCKTATTSSLRWTAPSGWSSSGRRRSAAAAKPEASGKEDNRYQQRGVGEQVEDGSRGAIGEGRVGIPPEEESLPPPPPPAPREVNPLDEIDFKAVPADPMTVAETLVKVRRHRAAVWGSCCPCRARWKVDRNLLSRVVGSVARLYRVRTAL